MRPTYYIASTVHVNRTFEPHSA